MLGKLTEKYLELSRGIKEKVDTALAPFGAIFGVAIENVDDALELAKEAVEQTAEDLGYE